jgi:hypothetical protein
LVGLAEGIEVGLRVGGGVGRADGAGLGMDDGALVGTSEGNRDGISEGDAEGDTVGAALGVADGNAVTSISTHSVLLQLMKKEIEMGGVKLKPLQCMMILISNSLHHKRKLTKYCSTCK